MRPTIRAFIVDRAGTRHVVTLDGQTLAKEVAPGEWTASRKKPDGEIVAQSVICSADAPQLPYTIKNVWDVDVVFDGDPLSDLELADALNQFAADMRHSGQMHRKHDHERGLGDRGTYGNHMFGSSQRAAVLASILYARAKK